MTFNILDHFSIAVNDTHAARAFYDAVMAEVGVRKVYDDEHALGYGQRCNADDDAGSYFSVLFSPEAIANARQHWCFKAPSREAVDAAFRAGLLSGGKSRGEPGLRPDYHASYYGAFLADPTGNKIEFVCHAAQ